MSFLDIKDEVRIRRYEFSDNAFELCGALYKKFLEWV